MPDDEAALTACIVRLAAQYDRYGYRRMLAGKVDVREWKDALLANGLSAKTINGSYLAHVRTLYRLAKNDDLIDFDPTEGLRVREKKKAGKSRLPYLDEEVANILVLADSETKPHLHWVPWLLALTGSRVGEITQLWAKHVKYADGVHFLSITPTDDGGEIKTASSERDVPIHPAIIERGFLAFVESLACSIGGNNCRSLVSSRSIRTGFAKVASTGTSQ